MRTRFIGLALLVACGGAPTAPAPTVTGTWTGAVGAQVLTLSLNDVHGTVSGSGTLTNTTLGTRTVTAQGTFSDNVFAAAISSGSTQPFSLQATVAGTSMSGVVNGSGFTGNAITLTRQ